MIKKIFWTIYCILVPIAGLAAIGTQIDAIFNSPDVWNFILAFIGLILILAPAWFMWKGTKLLPIISILPVRIVSFVIGIFFVPLGIFFSLWGIWIKS